MIRNYKEINGIVINNKEHKLSQYADDTLFILDGTSKSLKETLNVLSKFLLFSGHKVNFDKTDAVRKGLNTCTALQQLKPNENYHVVKLTSTFLGIVSSCKSLPKLKK